MYKAVLLNKLSLMRTMFAVLYREGIKRKKTYSICSFQKSGRTWIRYFLANYINIYYKLDMVVDMHSVYDFVPAYNYKRLNFFFHVIEHIDNDIPLILSSHTVYKKHLYFKTPIIFVIRSVYDVIVSYYYHKTKHKSEFDGDISTFIRSDVFGVGRIVTYMNSWSKYLVNSDSLIVSYEDMHCDAKNTFSKIVSFLNIDVDENILSLAIEKSTFTNMKKSESDNRIPGHSYNLDDVNARRMRSGIVDDYVNHLNSDDIEYIRNYCSLNLNKQSKKIYNDMRITL